MGFIHMNGRVYDPEIGRFLSADPVIQAPYNTQSYNRYSYCFNNPLSYTDPSGYEWSEEALWNWMSSTSDSFHRDSSDQWSMANSSRDPISYAIFTFSAGVNKFVGSIIPTSQEGLDYFCWSTNPIGYTGFIDDLLTKYTGTTSEQRLFAMSQTSFPADDAYFLALNRTAKFSRLLRSTTRSKFLSKYGTNYTSTTKILNSVGAGSFQYPVKGGYYLSENQTIAGKVFAGGRNKKIREASRLCVDYGGKKNQWRKMWGNANISDEAGSFVGRAEVHWYEAHGRGKYEHKIKRWLE
ncbi:MAG: RHS repeat-associated core domain-containing protein [Desulfobacterales bacterium]|nr:RHS repeat-associated core domain-containing protein [Desulfobacterales bacterium]